MEQSELNRNQLIHPTGCDTKRLLQKKGIAEKKPLRMIKAKTGTWFGCNEPFENEERDRELAEKFLAKTTTSFVKI